MNRTFILRTAEIRNRAQAFVGEQAISEQPLEVVVRTYKPKRSTDANAYYWSILHVIADELGYGAEELHHALKLNFLPSRYVDVANTAYVVPISSATLKVKDFAQYVDKVISFAAEQGIKLPAREV